MRITIPTRQPFSFAQTLSFMARFPPCQQATILTGDAVTAAVAIGGRAWPFTIREVRGKVVVDVPDRAPAEQLARRAADLIGADDDLTALYAAAKTDAPFRPVIDALHGLHHVRFMGLEEIAVYCVMMQRNPVQRAAQLKRRFLARFGLPAGELRAMPELSDLAQLDARDIGEAIGHAPKGERIATVVRGVHAIGEDFLRTARYEDAMNALLEIPGVGPFSAAAILLRGLGRMQHLPTLSWFADEARAIYGDSWNERAILRRYGDSIGYWSFYLKNASSRLPSASARS